MRQLARSLLLFVAAMLVVSLAVSPTFAQERPEYWPTDAWAFSTPEDQGMASGLLADGVRYLSGQDELGRLDIHSLTVIRRGHIVADVAYDPFTEDGLHELMSVTKSVTSTLVGMAIDHGYIKGVDQPVLEVFGDGEVANVDANKEAMTIADLLTMSSGLDCSPVPDGITTRQMMASSDWVQFALDLPMADPPGTQWIYCNAVSHLLSAIVAEATGMSTEAFAREHLFEPLGITEVIWPTDPQGCSLGYVHLTMRPHDLAKLGYLYLHDGEWGGQQVLSRDWVAASTTPGVASHYGYQWWLGPSWFYASGYWGQRLYVFPDQDLIVVTTAGMGGLNPDGVVNALLTRYVLPSIVSDGQLPVDPDGQAALSSAVREAAAPPVTSASSPEPVSEVARSVSGQRFLFDANPMGVQAVTPSFHDNAEAILEVLCTDGSDLDALCTGGSDLEWQIGLDGIARQGTGWFGLPTAATGVWESDGVLAVQVDEIGLIRKRDLRLTFQDHQVTIESDGESIVATLAE